MWLFYHIKNLQSTKTCFVVGVCDVEFYHIKNLQSTKTPPFSVPPDPRFYHIKNLQSTKTRATNETAIVSFITLRIYKVLKL